MSEKRAYNLRSGGSEAVTVPVQFEVSDKNFMSRLLQCQQNTSQSGQVSDSDSGSENNCNMSNAESDNEENQGSKVLVLTNKYQVVQMPFEIKVLILFHNRRLICKYSRRCTGTYKPLCCDITCMSDVIGL